MSNPPQVIGNLAEYLAQSLYFSIAQTYVNITGGAVPPGTKGMLQVADTQELIRLVRKFALANYDHNGWDYVVESFSDDEIAQILRKSRTVDGALHRVSKVVRLLDSARREVQAEADEPAIRLTEKELRVLGFMILSGRDANGSRSAEELIADNVTWTSVDDLVEGLSVKKQSAGALLKSLETKGMVANSGESARGGANPDWTVTNAGIRAGWVA